MTSPRQQLADLLARTPTRTLLASLVMLDAQPRSPETALVRGKTIDEVERRYPAAAAAVEAAYDEAELAALVQVGGEPADVDYVAVLLAAVESEIRKSA